MKKDKDITLLEHLLCCGFCPEDYLDLIDNIESALADREYFSKYPEETTQEELSFIDDDIETWIEKNV